jgi:hypothetical protein
MMVLKEYSTLDALEEVELQKVDKLHMDNLEDTLVEVEMEQFLQ